MQNVITNLEAASICYANDQSGTIENTVNWLNASIRHNSASAVNGIWYDIVLSQQVSICEGRRGSFAGTICENITETKTPFTTGKKTWGFANLQDRVNPLVYKANESLKTNTLLALNINSFATENAALTQAGIIESQDVFKTYKLQDKTKMKSGFSVENVEMKTKLNFPSG